MQLFLFLTLGAALPSALGALLLSRVGVRPILIHAAGVSGPLLAICAGLCTALLGAQQGSLILWQGLLLVDPLSSLLLVVIALVSGLTVLYSIPYLGRELAQRHTSLHKIGWYYFWLDLLIATMFLTVVLQSLGLTWVFIEATTLASVPLVGYAGTSRSLEASWKYLIIASVGISFALLGLLLTYVAAVTHVDPQQALDVTVLLRQAGRLDPGLIKLAFVFVLIGYGTKAGLAPMHTWLPDAHSQAPAPISALLSGALLNCALYGILRFTSLANAVLSPAFTSPLFQLFGLFSIGIAIPFLLHQQDLKRMLAYSSVEHIGIILVALGIGGEFGRMAVALHVLNHAITKAVLFCVAGEVTERYHTREIRALRGMFQTTPLLGTLLLLGILAITGMPPFTLFLSELLVVTAAVTTQHYLTAAVLLLLLWLFFASLIAHTTHMVFGRGMSRKTATLATVVPRGSETLAVAPPLALPGVCGWAERTALGLLFLPLPLLVVFGLWLPSGVLGWFHLIGAILQ